MTSEHILSFGIDYWRDCSQKVKKLDPKTVMDLATGSGMSLLN